MSLQMRAQAIFSCCVQESSAGTEHVGLASDGACASALVGAASNVKTAMARKRGRMENRPGSKEQPFSDHALAARAYHKLYGRSQRRRGRQSAFGAKRTLTEPRLRPGGLRPC